MKITDIVKLAPVVVTESRRFQEPEFTTESEIVSGTVKLGPYTVNFDAKVYLKNQLGEEIYPASFHDPAEYGDDDIVGFVGDYDECEIKFTSIIGPDGKPVQGADFMYTYYFHDDEGEVMVDKTREDFFVDITPKTEFDKFILDNQDAVFNAFVQALNNATAEYAKNFGSIRYED